MEIRANPGMIPIRLLDVLDNGSDEQRALIFTPQVLEGFCFT